ncbi:MAG: acetolactate synthase [Alphaproteobacteria bacterium]|nr:acetolactate synthase [Alphaproteobacteria bacterium]MBT4086150.1 acetolactate synthase [Alphaproteobacteria bacterium]MBT4543767.1 acetolactate synthase [Alphaproteobacteria bacterium]MBT7744012.1 acetolactate synthase [Alphaproteobacteria bacterium]
MSRRAADLLIDCLQQHNLTRGFCVPGESYLPVLDAISSANNFDVITCRHEGGAGFMAVADAKLTGEPGIAFVSRGPGATNASIAVHTAEQDAAPMILFIGQVSRDDLGRGAFQEVDYETTFEDMAKWVHTIVDPETLPEVIAAAVRIAKTPTQGPVVIVLPEDMLDDEVDVQAEPPQAVIVPAVVDADVAKTADMIAAAERPLVIVGGETAGLKSGLIQMAETWNLPIVPSFKRQDLFPNEHANFGGYLGYNIPRPQVEIMSEADLIIALGTRLGDATTQGYVLPTAPEPSQPLIHIYPDPYVPGKVFETALGLVCGSEDFLESLATCTPAFPASGRQEWIERLNGHARSLSDWGAKKAPDGIDFGFVIAELQKQISGDAIIATDAGNFSSWLHRHFQFGEKHTLLGAVAGAMGMGVPAAVAAAFRCPERQVVTLVGDGGFMMTGNELATAVQYELPIKILLSDNGAFGTIRTHQEKHFPGRISATALTNPDFAMMANAYGALGIDVSDSDQIGPALSQALEHHGPALINFHSSLEHISAYTTIAGLRNK